MGQLGFSDLDKRYRSLDAKKDPLVFLNEVVPWEDFRARLSAVWRKPAEERKTAAGRKPWDEIVIFQTLVLQALYNLSDDQLEYQICDRLSFMRFLGLGLADRGPDATTVWLYREKLAQAGLIEALFDAFDAHLKSRGYLAMGGQIVDASIVSAPVQRNSRAENTAIKDGDPPGAWKPNKKAQKDVDARWTKKHGKSYFGYKNHVNIDRKHKLMRRYTVTDAAVHDSQQLEAILDPSNTASDVWADTAYRPKEGEEKLAEKGLRSRIHRRASRGKPLSQRAQEASRTRSKVRARRARLRPSAHQHGWEDRAHDRPRTSQGKDRPDEPRVQHQPIGLPGADGHARIAGERRSSTTRAPIAAEGTPLPGPPSLDSWKGLPSKPSKSASRPNIAPRSPKARIFRGALIHVLTASALAIPLAGGITTSSQAMPLPVTSVQEIAGTAPTEQHRRGRSSASKRRCNLGTLSAHLRLRAQPDG